MAQCKVTTIPNEFSQDLEKVLNLLSHNDINYVELASMWDKDILDLSPEEEDKVENLLDQYGMEVSAIQTQIMKCYPRDSPHAKPGTRNMHADADYNLSRIDRAIELAQRFKTDNIVTYSYLAKEGVTEQNWGRMLDDYEGLVMKCAKANKILVLENEHDCYVGLIDDVYRIMTHFNSPHLRWLFDTGNLFMKTNNFTKDDFEKVKEFIGYWHVKDVKKSLFGKSKKWAVFGKGMVPSKEIFSYFIKDGYTGYFSAEPHQHGAKKWDLATEHVLNMKKALDSL
jgi:sugar phosphate isomerase/epimerase